MNPPYSPDTWRNFLPVGVTFLLGAVGLGLTWLKDWGQNARNSRFLDQSAKNIQFWESSLKALTQVQMANSNDRDAAEEELKRAIHLARVGLRARRPPHEWTANEFETYKAGLNPVRRLLLLYKQPSKAARRIKILGVALALFPLIVICLDEFDTTRSDVVSGPPLFGFVILINITVFSRFMAYVLETIYISELRSAERVLAFCKEIRQRHLQSISSAQK